MVVPTGHATDRVAHAPIRTCVACGRASTKSSLARLAVRDGSVVWDRWVREPGRGAYMCVDRGCVERLVRRDGARLVRALRAEQGTVVDQAALVAVVSTLDTHDDPSRQE